MRRVLVVCFLALFALTAAVAHQSQSGAQQGGDQFLDGIGETSLIARYQFNGNLEDSSRNQLHARMAGPGGAFVDDGGRRVLLLTGDGSYVQLPANALAGEDAVAVVGWLYMPTRATGPIFDFGANASTRLSAVVDAQGFRASAIVDGKVRGETPAKTVVENQWTHFAVVLDPASNVLTAYVDGARAGQATNVSVSPAQILPATSTTNRLLLGRAQDDGAPTVHARFRDLRLYRVALGDEPVATIRRNALAAAAAPQQARGRGAAPEISAANIPRESPFAATLVKVSHVSVETPVGVLPRLPAFVPATHAGGVIRDVRVIWPSPTDNASVLKPGTYTVAGRIPGTILQANATVVVKTPVRAAAPPERLVEAFALDRVLLEKDSKGRDTQFMKNRDKFLHGLAQSNPDSFLYNFRETFGQPQPAGARALGGWDSQTTRLRGHASGHYLTAIAQAYASTGYDPALQKTFVAAPQGRPQCLRIGRYGD